MLRFETKNPVIDPAIDAAGIANACRISLPIAKILISRGYDSVESIKEFLDPSLEHLHDPYLLKDIDLAVKRIREAIDRREHIVVYGDYDADGVTASTLLYQALKERDVHTDVFLPERRTDGYGLHDGCIARIIEEHHPELIITVDCGITAVEEIAHAKEKNVDVIVTDHHVCPEVLPDAIACVNPKRLDQEYPFDGLAGVGVAAKLVQSLFGLEALYPYLDIVAVGTIADIVPLVDENRVLVSLGLEKLKKETNPGIKALIDVAGNDIKTISSTDIGFVLAPRINAGGRMASTMISFSLLNAENYSDALVFAAKLNELNQLRQMTERQITQEAIDRIENGEIDLIEHRFICMLSKDWDEGVIGIVASRLCEKYTRPVLLFTEQDETDSIKGSGRSIDGVDLFLLLNECSDLYEQFGGHARAVGLTMNRENLTQLITRIENKLASFDDVLFVPQAEYDSEAELFWFNNEFMDDLQLLEPFGYGNAIPAFLFRNTVPRQTSQIGREKNHLRFFLQSENRSVQTIAFGIGNAYDRFLSVPSFDFIVTAKYNLWQNRKEIQFLLKSFRPSTDALGWRNYLVTRDDVYEESFFTDFYSSAPYDAAVKIRYSESIQEIKEDLHASKQGLLIVATTLSFSVLLLRDLESEISSGLVDVCFRNTVADKRYFNTLLICPEKHELSNLSGFQNILVFGLPIPGLNCDGIVPDEEMIRNVMHEVRKPSREIIGKIYKLLHTKGLSLLNTDIARKTVVKWCIDVFSELNLISVDDNGIRFVDHPNKVLLSDSQIYRKAAENYLEWVQYTDYLCEDEPDE
ncbi:MAG: single-stranded-DNA-specific exonuclease RecJ [Clostridia bacterium]|nr:single-stranded-DNA-specific exonuclease RecJ [Clostridia bacterium]